MKKNLFVNPDGLQKGSENGVNLNVHEQFLKKINKDCFLETMTISCSSGLRHDGREFFENNVLKDNIIRDYFNKESLWNILN